MAGNVVVVEFGLLFTRVFILNRVVLIEATRTEGLSLLIILLSVVNRHGSAY